LDLQAEIRLLELATQVRVLASQLCDLLGLGRGRLRSAAATGERRERSLAALGAPLREVARVEPLSPQDGADLAGRTAGIDLLEDAELVLGAEVTPRGAGADLGRGRRRGGGGGTGRGGRTRPGIRRRLRHGNLSPSILNFGGPVSHLTLTERGAAT